MTDKKLTLEELANLNDGTRIDMEVVNNNEDGSYALIKDEINDYIDMCSKKQKVAKPSFFSTLPCTDLKKSIESVIKVKNVKEEILKKNVQYEFDAKMARIRKIKSKTYRRMKRREKLKKLEMLNLDSDADDSDVETTTEGSEQSNIEELQPVISFERKDKHDFNDEGSDDSGVEVHLNGNADLVSKAFEVPGFEENEKAFLEEKQAVIQEDAPSVIEHHLPGWDDWAGEGIEFQANKINTIVEKKNGIRNKDRKDYLQSNLIINEHQNKNEKYQSSKPYGYTGKDYLEKLNTNISPETNSFRIFNKFVKGKNSIDHKAGEAIKPKEFNPEY